MRPLRRIKPEWLPLLHAARRREFERIFGNVPSNAFDRVLELGAGDGYQSGLLKRHAVELVATELRQDFRPRVETPGVEYRICDAEAVGDAFRKAEFDVVYSSNLLEHLPDVERALRGIHRVLADDGIMIHVMPGPVWKLTHVMCYHPNLVITNLEMMLSEEHRRLQAARVKRWLSWSRHSVSPVMAAQVNNLKSARPTRSAVRNLLAPEPHGVARTNLAEFTAFSRRRWQREFSSAGFEVVRIIKGPVMSGYGFGLERLRALAEALGLASEFAYVAVKQGAVSRHAKWFVNADHDRLAR